MQSTHHEFEIFEDIINGELEPIKLFGEKLNIPISYLKEQHERCNVTTFVRVNKKKKSPDYEELIVPNIHPLACEYVNQQTLQTSNLFEDPSLREKFKQVNKGSSPGHTIVFDQKNTQLIGVYHTIEWKDLDPHLLKLCYYHQMLSDYVRNMKRNLFNEFYILDDDTVKRIVNRTHTRLINFCNQVIHKYDLNASDLEINVKPKYTDKDGMAIVYNHLNDLINFLVNDYYFFLHSEAHVPYNAEILRRYQLEETARKTMLKCKKVEVDNELKQILKQTINKVLNLDTKNRITYYEITYYSFFINELHRFISTYKEVNNNTLIIRLIELGFNNYDFIKYVTESIEREKISDELYLEYLLEKRKEWEQCILCENKIFNKDLEPIQINLMNWLNSEVEYYRFKIDQNNSQNIKKKLEVDLSVSQLALITRLFHEVAMTPETSISETATSIVENYKTPNSSSISLKSFMNNLYKFENSTISEVKSKLIEMVNRVNEL